MWNIHAELSKVLIFFFFNFFSLLLLFSPPLTWLSSPLIIMPWRFPGRGAAIRLNHLDKAAWPNYTRAPSGFDVAEKPRDRGKLHSHIMVMIWFNPATKLYVACLKKDANANYRGAQRCRVGSRREGWAEGRLAAATKLPRLVGVRNRQSAPHKCCKWKWDKLDSFPFNYVSGTGEKVRGTEEHVRNLQTCWATASNWHILGGEVERLQRWE